MTQRGDVCWADLGEPHGSKPAKRRPVLVIQADPYNASRLSTTLAAVITSSTSLAAMPGNVFVPAVASGLPRDSVVNVTALVTLDKTDLDPAVGQLPASLMHEVDRGLRRVLGLLSRHPARRSSGSDTRPGSARIGPPRRRTAAVGLGPARVAWLTVVTRGSAAELPVEQHAERDTAASRTAARCARYAANERVAQATLSKSKLYHSPSAKKRATEPRQ